MVFISLCLSACVCVNLCKHTSTHVQKQTNKKNPKNWGDDRGVGGGGAMVVVGGITSLNHFNFSQCLFSSWAERRENL